MNLGQHNTINKMELNDIFNPILHQHLFILRKKPSLYFLHEGNIRKFLNGDISSSQLFIQNLLPAL